MRMLSRLSRKIRQCVGVVRGKTSGGDRPVESGGLAVRDVEQLIGKNARVILEIGANNGNHTRQFAEAFPQASIYAFEPDARAWEQLSEVAKQFRNVRPFNLAVSSQDGEAQFHCSGGQRPGERATVTNADWHKSGSLCQPSGHIERHPWCTFDRTITVATRSLDSLLSELDVKAVDFVWMDVQGAERLVLEGAKESLRAVQYLYTEYSNEELYKGQPTLKEILTLASGFEVVRQFAGDVLLKNRLWKF